MELTQVGSDSNNLRNKALITSTTYGYPRMQVCRLVKYCHPMHAQSSSTSAVHVIHYSN